MNANLPSIKLSNGHVFTWMVASGALAFDGKGWPWERFLKFCGFIEIDYSLFTIVVKSLTVKPRKGNLRWWHPWTCVRSINGGWVNKVGLTNPGIDWWMEKIGRKIDSRETKIVGSAFGNGDELLHLVLQFNECDLVGTELNYSCPNSGQGMQAVEALLKTARILRRRSKHPLIYKLSATGPYLQIARALSEENLADAISLNSVPWESVYPKRRTPLHRLEAQVKGGGGGVSGKAAQQFNWRAVNDIAFDPDCCLPVIGPSIWEYEDIGRVDRLGATAFSFGSIFIGRPGAPTRYVRRYLAENAAFANHN